MDDKLRSLMQGAFDTAKSIVIKGDEVIPVFFARWEDTKVGMYMTPWTDEQSKQAMLMALKLAFAARGVDSYVSVSEAWAIKRDKGFDPEKSPSPSQCEDREEIMILTGVSHDGVIAATAKLGREGDKRTIGDLTWLPGDHQMSGRMLELLPPEGCHCAPQHIIEKIESMIGLKIEEIPSVH